MNNKCVFCGVEIPEGRQVCPNCETNNNDEAIKKINDFQFDDFANEIVRILLGDDQE